MLPLFIPPFCKVEQGLLGPNPVLDGRSNYIIIQLFENEDNRHCHPTLIVIKSNQ